MFENMLLFFALLAFFVIMAVIVWNLASTCRAEYYKDLDGLGDPHDQIS